MIAIYEGKDTAAREEKRRKIPPGPGLAAGRDPRTTFRSRDVMI